ncbi:endo-1,4-beta xylanase [Mycena floridula]|nr:endo-1,4-beta xylanase [Mycena floridula]
MVLSFFLLSLATLTVAQSNSKLNTAAKAAGKLFLGSATDNPELTNAPYVAILSDPEMFGQITPGNSMKWDATEPSPGTFTFTQADAIANLAKQNGQLLRGRSFCILVGYLPSWVSTGGFNNQTLLGIVTRHCSTRSDYFCIWSLTSFSEPFNDDGTFRTDVFFNTTGTQYIATALRAARAADPNAKLYINEFNIEFAGPKLNALVDLAKSLLAEGVPLDGIGFQAHLIVGSIPTDLAANLAKFTALGLEVAITELDIRMTLPSSTAQLAQQKADYTNVINACMSVSKCIGITLWDYTDKFSWVPSTFPGQGAACAWDENLAEKPAFSGILAGFASGMQFVQSAAQSGSSAVIGSESQ